MYRNWINGILGLIVFTLAFVDVAETTLAWALGILGGLIALTSFWGAVASQDEEFRMNRKDSHRIQSGA